MFIISHGSTHPGLAHFFSMDSRVTPSAMNESISATEKPAAPRRSRTSEPKAGVARPEARVVEAELGGQPRPEIGEHDIGPGDQRLDDARGGGMPEVEGKRVLAAIARDEVPRLAGRERQKLAGLVAGRRLDLDDVGAALGEELRAERDGDELAELDDLEPGERLLARHDGRKGAPPSGAPLPEPRSVLD